MEQKTFDFTITKKDYENSNKDFTNPWDCPARIALTRQFPNKGYLNLMWNRVYGNAQGDDVGVISGSWDAQAFNALRDNGTEFKAQITFF